MDDRTQNVDWNDIDPDRMSPSGLGMALLFRPLLPTRPLFRAFPSSQTDDLQRELAKFAPALGDGEVLWVNEGTLFPRVPR